MKIELLFKNVIDDFYSLYPPNKFCLKFSLRTNQFYMGYLHLQGSTEVNLKKL